MMRWVIRRCRRILERRRGRNLCGTVGGNGNLGLLNKFESAIIGGLYQRKVTFGSKDQNLVEDERKRHASPTRKHPVVSWRF
jgi:hypothetical protein